MNLNKINKEEVSLLQKNYYKTFLAPLDDMWELGIIASGQFYEILNPDRIGYLVVNGVNELVEFHLIPDNDYDQEEILSACIKNLEIKKAYACTYEPNYLGLCLSLSKTHGLNGLFYKQYKKKVIDSPDESIICVKATSNMLDEVIVYSLTVLEVSKDWLKYYYNFLLETGNLMLFKLKGVMIGTGEMRPSNTSRGYANLGMTVSPDYRYKGLGSYIINEMAKFACEEGLKPICGTDVLNIGSQKAMVNSGFKVYHRVFTIEF